jgi:hypothetical protein
MLRDRQFQHERHGRIDNAGAGEHELECVIRVKSFGRSAAD